MDNITHSLIGLAIGEAVAVHRKKARLPIWIASAMANNLPDFDLIQTSLFFPDRLGYMLHHRGHTHTLVAAPLLGALLLFALWCILRKRPDIPWKEIVFVSILGSFTHLLADFWNSYGVHPFWPVNSNWFYGDLVFIVEPWIWALILPMIFFACTSKWGKALCLLLLAFITGLAWKHEAVPLLSAAVLSAGVFLSFLLQSRISTRGRRVTVSILLTASILLGLWALSQSVRKEYGRPGAELALHPFPANPLCWSALRASLNETEYRAEAFTIAPFPFLFPVGRCPNLLGASITAPLAPSLETGSPGVKYLGAFSAPRSELEALSQDCRMNAFLRYARIPFWKKFNGGWIVGDLRYDREEGLGFTELFLPPEPVNCPRGVPPWIGRFHPEGLRAIH
jgi:inner membrane protein